ncbi:SDR family oxidoreductase [Pusillimonas noertemannii]|uniref:2,3-dihydroxy-2,3-dihydrophenylpropionate dehydrogenase n=1 Tax=Pusillimonas noertemannii TaxID=305977 RepID=A0A2U1CMS6_9BURK|nr:SDR family oxidoreductase [Pusillimonas noertemannii]NYT68680.1 SDR family oxidoreductase [Pusillimonas noertemannii]PVY62302.1 2,3-dihydroxy-2,3-dihydrophenylpropionate dehydrogenase [Pusillimonas noertemannii]TFL10723.1 SDR family oxidoreductase [Pusillimonas noertemannii]
MSQQLQNRVALITGAASGLGLAITQRFLAEGAGVVAFDRSGPALQREFGASDVVCCEGDARSQADNARAVALAQERFGRLDVLVANAGVYDNRKPFLSFSASELETAFDELFAINVKGYMLAARAAADILAQHRGSIIFTSSVSGTHAGFGGALYVSAKHAINGLTRQLALELAPHVRVNAVAPGYVPTALRGLESLGQSQNPSAPAATDLPLQAIATPQDYASAYAFLASDAAAHMATGSILDLNGGTALRGPRL